MSAAAAVVTEQRIDGLRWLVVKGSRTAALRALGEYARDQVVAALAALLPPLRRHVGTEVGGAAFDAVRLACRRQQPVVWSELVALADGAGVPFDDLLLVNLRGDLGSVAAGAGCSDLAWRGARSVIGHNEDGDPALDGQCALVTLHIDGEPGVTAYWYPGFLPSNAFAATDSGLIWGIDHVTIPEPAAAAGRHFVARALQRCRDLDEASALLTDSASAGGFAYTIGEVATGRIVTVEAAAGHAVVKEIHAGEPQLSWHTNHLRHLDLPSPVAADSAQRGRILAAVAAPADPDVEFFLDVLTATGATEGVHRDGAGGGSTLTLCTVVTDLTAAEVTIAPFGATPTTIGFADLVAGRAP